MLRVIACLGVVLAAGCSGASQAKVEPAGRQTASSLTATPETLAFTIDDGGVRNLFFRRGPVAAHLLTRSGGEPRLIVSFPAGNAGIGLWFAKTTEAVELSTDGPLVEAKRPDGMWGVRTLIRSTARRLVVGRSVLGGNWSLRGYVPPGLTFPPLRSELGDAPPSLSRVTVDGKHRLRIELEAVGSTTITATGGVLQIASSGGAGVAFRMTALCNEAPMTPIPVDELLVDRHGRELRDLQALAFLSYKEKLLAGSWRFLDYFGRDTLLSVRLLMPALKAPVIEAGLGAVIARLSPTGEVAHYEEAGDFVALRNVLTQPRPADLRRPWLNYEMIDADFMLAPVLTEYLLDHPAGRARRSAFLSRRTLSGQPFTAAVAKNLELVLDRARPFAAEPAPSRLVALRPDRKYGQWRDSDEGLGGGRYPFDVNVSLVPAALEAAARLHRSGLLGSVDEQRAREAERLASVWNERALSLFRVELPATVARKRIAAYARTLGLAPEQALTSLEAVASLVFHGIALDGEGKPVPVMHTDDAFLMLFNRPPPEFLEQVAQRLLSPFPGGLRTPVGVVVANPALAPEARLQSQFTCRHYHGTVIWSWQQALLAAGIGRQLQRADLPGSTRRKLESAETALWKVIQATRGQRAGELWTWKLIGSAFAVERFGEQSTHVDESNAVQLWSTVYLAVRKPARISAP